MSLSDQLRELLRLHPQLEHEPRRLEAFLRDAQPPIAPRDIKLVVELLAHGCPSRLRRSGEGEVQLLVRRLMDSTYLREEAVIHGLRCWSLAMGLSHDIPAMVTLETASPKQPVAAQQPVPLNQKVFNDLVAAHPIRERHDFHSGDDIPEGKLTNAAMSTNLPPGIMVWALVDCTVFGSARNALLITHHGLHWRNDWASETPGAFCASWEALRGHDITIKGSELRLPGGSLSMAGSQVKPAELKDLLDKLRSMVRVGQPP